jgi:hypothetical protein
MTSFIDRFYVPSGEDVGCGCCAGYALDSDDMWRCDHGSWIVTDTPTLSLKEMKRFNKEKSSICIFPDDPLQVRLFNSEFNGETWGDIMYDEILKNEPIVECFKERMEAMRVDAEEQRMREYAERKAKALADRAAAEASQKAREQGARANDARKAATAAAASVKIQKIAEPCKWLYCPPKSNGLFGNKVCSECWAHEYRNPKTGKYEMPHKCDRLHPGEPGWLPEWSTLSRPRNQMRFSRPSTPVLVAGRDLSALASR